MSPTQASKNSARFDPLKTIDNSSPRIAKAESIKRQKSQAPEKFKF